MNANTTEQSRGPVAPPVLAFEQVSKWFGPVLALNQVSFVLRPGITGLVGPNGAGKSTLIRLATGQMSPSLGEVRIRGMLATDWRALRRIGYCPDHDAFYERMTGRSFVQEMARLAGLGARVARERTNEVLERVGMQDRADKQLRGFSKGMRQRVKLAQALLLEPDVLILDEPLGGIDPPGRKEMIELFQSLASAGTSLLISSHELEELEKLTETIAIMARGRIAAVGTISQIRALQDDYPLHVRIVVDRPRDLARELLLHPGVLGVELQNSSDLKVQILRPQEFFSHLTTILATSDYRVSEFEPLDESTHAVLGYFLGGSGKT